MTENLQELKSCIEQYVSYYLELQAMVIVLQRTIEALPRGTSTRRELKLQVDSYKAQMESCKDFMNGVRHTLNKAKADKKLTKEDHKRLIKPIIHHVYFN